VIPFKGRSPEAEGAERLVEVTGGIFEAGLFVSQPALTKQIK